MSDIFIPTFMSVLDGLLKIFIIALLAGVLTYRKIISEELINGLSQLTVMIFLPLLIFHTIITGFDPSLQTYWWMIPIAAILLSSIGLLLSALLFAGSLKEKKSFLPLSAMQNAAYLVLPIGEFVYPGKFDEFSLICFLVVLGLSPFMWTVGKLILTGSGSGKRGWIAGILTPPFVANIVSILLVLSGGNRLIPDVITESAGFLGNATVPVATFILGATLARSLGSIPRFNDTIRVLLVKFVLLPAIVILAMKLTGTARHFPLLADVMIIQASSAPATAHILQIRTYGGNLKSAGGIIFVSYAVCMFAIPFWLSAWRIISLW